MRKTLYVLLLGTLAFNVMLTWTSSLGIFNASYEGTVTDEELGEYKNLTSSDTNILDMAVFGFNFGSLISSILIVGGAVLAAWYTKSPIPLAVGGFAAFVVGLWQHTYSIFYGFGLPLLWLDLGTAVFGILMVIAVIDIISPGGT